MGLQPVELTGGESVYCINESQLKRAYQMAAGGSLQEELSRLTRNLSRNDRAALAFLLIDSLRKSDEGEDGK